MQSDLDMYLRFLAVLCEQQQRGVR